MTQQVNLGDLRRLDPLSRNWGFDRGTPVDRFYIEGFLRDHATSVRGRCLELLNNTYTLRYGGDDVTNSHILDIDSTNPRATVVADLSQVGSLATMAYDCIILTQVLQFIHETTSVLANVWQALAPGGAALITVPHVHKVHPDPEDHWRFTPMALERLMEKNMPGAIIEVKGVGNVLTCAAFLYGLSCEELSREELEHDDPAFPLTVTAIAKKPNVTQP